MRRRTEIRSPLEKYRWYRRVFRRRGLPLKARLIILLVLGAYIHLLQHCNRTLTLP